MSLEPGSRLGSYEILARLGAGGMGEVYRARDPRLARDVAVKVLRHDRGAAPAQRERFFREARAASALNHPNIVTIHEIGEDQAVDYIVMECVRGRTLAEHIAAGRPSMPHVTTWIGQLAEGLARAHAAGVIHRDLKPANVMVTDDGLVKILDFGLAKIAAGDDEDAAELPTQAALTRAGTSVGTLGYMSPEQALGASVDARSDVFSFGVIVYELLAGRRPFSGPSASEMLRQLHFEEPAFGAVRSDAPRVLVAVMRRCLEKRPEDRYASMGAVAEVLRAALGPGADHATRQEPSVDDAPPAPAAAPAAISPDRGGRRRAAAGLALAGALVAAALVVAPRLGTRQGAPPATTTAAPAVPAGTASALTSQGAQRLARQDRDDDLAQAIELLEAAVQRDATHAPAYALLSEAYLRRYKVSPDAQWLALARDRADRAVALNPDLAVAHLALALAQNDAGERVPAEQHARRAVELDPRNGLAHAGLAFVLASAGGRDADAEAAFRRAADLAPDEWRVHNPAGQFFYQHARYAEAIAAWERALAATPDNLLVLRNLGAAYFRAGRRDEAASTLQRALEIRPSGPVYTNLGNIYFQQGRFADAVSAFEKALEQDANNYAYWGNLGDAYRWAAGRRADAPAAYRHAVDLLAGQLAKKPGDPDLHTRSAVYLAKAGDMPAALAHVGVVADATLTAQMLFRLAVVHELGRDRTAALAAVDRALKAGYPSAELGAEPELAGLRADPRYHRLVGASPR